MPGVRVLVWRKRVEGSMPGLVQRTQKLQFRNNKTRSKGRKYFKKIKLNKNEKH